jgi:CHAT domain-containing protein
MNQTSVFISCVSPEFRQIRSRVAAILTRLGLDTYRFTAKETTKETLLKIHSPYILHLATHGFFAKEDPTSAKTEPEATLDDLQSVTKSKFFKNPMHCSGLALAGAQTTIDAWKREEVPPVENDGILTAEDVSTLDLQGTRLVTLSACDNGRDTSKPTRSSRSIRSQMTTNRTYQQSKRSTRLNNLSHI